MPSRANAWNAVRCCAMRGLAVFELPSNNLILYIDMDLCGFCDRNERIWNVDNRYFWKKITPVRSVTFTVLDLSILTSIFLLEWPAFKTKHQSGYNFKNVEG